MTSQIESAPRRAIIIAAKRDVRWPFALVAMHEEDSALDWPMVDTGEQGPAWAVAQLRGDYDAGQPGIVQAVPAGDEAAALFRLWMRAHQTLEAAERIFERALEVGEAERDLPLAMSHRPFFQIDAKRALFASPSRIWLVEGQGGDAVGYPVRTSHAYSVSLGYLMSARDNEAAAYDALDTRRQFSLCAP